MNGLTPSFITRLRMIIPKICERGFGWFTNRLAAELGSKAIYARFLRALLARGLDVARILSRIAAADTSDDTKNKTLFFFYDLDVNPITFNVVDDLLAAELMRRRHGKRDLHVVVVPGHERGLRYEESDYESIVDWDSRYWRLHNLLIPLFSLLASCRGYTICDSRSQAEQIFGLANGSVFPEGYRPNLPLPLQRRKLFDAARRGEAVWPALAAPKAVRCMVNDWLNANSGGRRAIVITLRQYAYMPQRNSHLADWAEFVSTLDKSRYFPVIVPDTSCAFDKLPDKMADVAVFSAASWNMTIRLALYEQAWLNVAVVHGPTELCWFSETCRYLLFMDLDSAPQTSRKILEQDGFEIGGQLPWATDVQRWVWATDEAKNLIYEFKRMAEFIAGISQSDPHVARDR